MGASKAWIAAAIGGALVLGVAAAETKPPQPRAQGAGTAKSKPAGGTVQHADLKRAKEAKPARKPVTAKASAKKATIAARAPAKKTTVTAHAPAKKAAATAHAPAKKGVVTAKSKPAAKKPVLTAKTPLRKTTITARREPEKRYLPPPVSMNWTPPPLGPERFYPNGIPELHPAFMHPLPGDAPVQTTTAAGPSSGESELRN
ncbi:hypothetical protein [Ramlibacter humi]|uniref:Histone n=1 Tax=Ramlibacter humi TaxID=2530451 RepID=A0A4Z0BFT6_9BURK|nr:hypothetical protein [Ramlibacter humi]TFY98196.1 hypothetical protein EZ216_16470 [Ramlibacter humi]